MENENREGFESVRNSACEILDPVSNQGRTKNRRESKRWGRAGVSYSRETNEIKTDLSGAGVQLKSTRNSFGLLRYCNFRLSMGPPTRLKINEKESPRNGYVNNRMIPERNYRAARYTFAHPNRCFIGFHRV